jgi:hypothetical protein
MKVPVTTISSKLDASVSCATASDTGLASSTRPVAVMMGGSLIGQSPLGIEGTTFLVGCRSAATIRRLTGFDERAQNRRTFHESAYIPG